MTCQPNANGTGIMITYFVLYSIKGFSYFKRLKHKTYNISLFFTGIFSLLFTASIVSRAVRPEFIANLHGFPRIFYEPILHLVILSISLFFTILLYRKIVLQGEKKEQIRLGKILKT